MRLIIWVRDNVYSDFHKKGFIFSGGYGSDVITKKVLTEKKEAE